MKLNYLLPKSLKYHSTLEEIPFKLKKKASLK